MRTADRHDLRGRYLLFGVDAVIVASMAAIDRVRRESSSTR
jgi:hypothetical protein